MGILKWLGLRKARPDERSMGGKVVRVGPGETLRAIAKREYGDEAAWERIYQANLTRVKDAEAPEIGTELTLP